MTPSAASVTVRFRFGALYRANLLDPTFESTQSDFGKVRSVEDARAIQMSLRFTFSSETATRVKSRVV